MNTRVPRRRFLFLLPATLFFAGLAPAQVQTAPITEPRGAQSAGRPARKGADAITTQKTKCMKILTVEGAALFVPHRWTLNPDAKETLDVLGPMIVKVGKRPAEISAETSAADSDDENRDVAHRRAITVRTWLINHHFVPNDISMEEYNPDKPVALPGQTPSLNQRERNNGLISVIIDTCP